MMRRPSISSRGLTSAGLSCLFVLLAAQLVAADLFMLNQTTSDASPVVLSDYVHASFGPFDFTPITLVPLFEIPRNCAEQEGNLTTPSRFVAVWQRSGMWLHYIEERFFLMPNLRFSHRTGSCAFETISLRVQDLGAVALIIVNWEYVSRRSFDVIFATRSRIPALWARPAAVLTLFTGGAVSLWLVC